MASNYAKANFFQIPTANELEFQMRCSEHDVHRIFCILKIKPHDKPFKIGVNKIIDVNENNNKLSVSIF
jgi:hypothetical protein